MFGQVQSGREREGDSSACKHLADKDYLQATVIGRIRYNI
ncbi:hypothetical protein SEA_WEASELS2_293 [Rhodococcus phage Weasels2]|uniref:Uncharacterized protein n=1 Tax=Rhodococcus phage Weasels2 TaxID=1897437 RepID=A0A1I9SAR5_9CAUD|nr:hypothetical protein FDH04_gp007 [Rhodococcus phage Weasels2]YP_009596585.1 hypothetical protein FDH04_gp123 [Rhodococcus phage Weasels2]AOZ63597.1 hypothetical protein SEA_WEASELS2_7 [Rhodococcus phage Weasels2]AOZ63871.1 hypothetical protein SEA_WEASELS2_293 [Rhodococcus phage Weasels2]